jgi:hypothetical protein
VRSATLTRISTGAEGSFGEILTDSGYFCVTGELPWIENSNNDSCIPSGTYVVNWSFSPKHNKNVYHVQNVPNRSEIEIHSANLMGDTSKGYVSQLLGCIAPGKSVATFPAGTAPAGHLAQKGVTSSTEALTALQADLGTDPWTLTIKWAAGVS